MLNSLPFLPARSGIAFLARYGSGTLSNELLNVKVDSQSLRTFAATQAVFHSLFFLSIGNFILKSAEYSSILKSAKYSSFVAQPTAMLISVITGAVIGKYMTNICNEKPMTWNQALKISAVQASLLTTGQALIFSVKLFD